MRSAVYDAYGAPVEVRDVDPPHCPADGVVVRVEATGVCRSDWHAWRGHDPVPLPMTPGHEWAGQILEVGHDVPDDAGWAPGDRVTAPFVLGCGRCAVCSRGDQHVCPYQEQPGFTRPGSWAEQVAVPAASANLVRLPEGLDPVAAASLGCRLATAHRAVVAQGRVRMGSVVVVHGCGGLGLAAVMIAASLGAQVVAVDPSEPARERALAAGAREAVDPAAHADLAATLRGMADVDVSLDAAGAPGTADASVRCLRPRGRHVQVGLLLGDAALAVPMDVVVAKEIEVVGSHGMAAGAYPDLLEMVADGRLDPHSLVARQESLEAAGDELAAMGAPSPSGGIVVLVP